MEISIEARKTIGQQRIKIEAKAATREMGDSPSIEGHCMLSEVRVKSLGQFDMLRPPARSNQERSHGAVGRLPRCKPDVAILPAHRLQLLFDAG